VNKPSASPAARPISRGTDAAGLFGRGCPEINRRSSTRMKTIVIVDDHEDNRALLVDTLAERDYRLIEASSGEEALAAVGKEEPDLVIADVLMPRMDGYEFVRQLRQDARNAQTKVIFYTASYIEEESKRLAKACGVDHIIVKPADPETVLQIVDDALGERSKPAATIPTPEFEREHLHLVTDKLSEKVKELEMLTHQLEQEIAERKSAEKQLLRAQRLESIGTLAGGVAHDLNNVLGPILMGAESLRSNATGEHAAAMISLIEESARRGSSIVKQVLTFARGVEGERVLIDPRYLIDEMVEIARKTFPKSIEVTGQYPEHPWSISGDPTQLHQVLLNLSTNARDAMTNGGSLILAAENLEMDDNYAAMMPGAKAGLYAVLRVSDTGVGIPRALLEKVFEPFFTTKDLGKGTGLGLSTSLGIVKSHAGFISVSSEQGRGTTFKVFLPAVQTDVAPPQKESPRLIEGNGELVLLVDDEINICRVTKMALEKHNYRVLEANDSPEALAIFAQQMDSVSVILTDIMMPYIDGVALIRALKKMKPDMIFIASTGQDGQPRLAELQELGVMNFLSKPYDTTKLLTVLKEAISNQVAPLSKKAISGAQYRFVAHSLSS
jgi:signal transduction histidine kinase